MLEKIKMIADDNGEVVELFVLEQTRVNGTDYILVADSETDDGECMILKDTAEAGARDSIYEFVEDDTELDAVFKIFTELLEDVDIEK